MLQHSYLLHGQGGRDLPEKEKNLKIDASFKYIDKFAVGIMNVTVVLALSALHSLLLVGSGLLLGSKSLLCTS